MKNTDLHTHTNYSDGTLSPEEVVRRAKEKGVKCLAITDHNSVNGLSEAMEEGIKIGVEIIPGVEIKILGYFIDPKDKNLNLLLNEIKKSSIERIKNYCRSLKERGHNLDFQELIESFPNAKDNLNWYHVCYFLYNKNFKSSIKEVTEYLMSLNIIQNNTKNNTVERVIKIIKNSGGVPVLAHPWITSTSRGFLEEETMKKLVHAGLKGIEIDQGDRNEKRSEEVVRKIELLAKKHNLILTSGSDFHGDFLIDQNEDPFNHELGAHNCEDSIVKQLRAAREVFQTRLSEP